MDCSKSLILLHDVLITSVGVGSASILKPITHKRGVRILQVLKMPSPMLPLTLLYEIFHFWSIANSFEPNLSQVLQLLHCSCHVFPNSFG